MFVKVKDNYDMDIIINTYTLEAFNFDGTIIICGDCLKAKVFDASYQLLFNPENKMYFCKNPKHPRKKVR